MSGLHVLMWIKFRLKYGRIKYVMKYIWLIVILEINRDVFYVISIFDISICIDNGIVLAAWNNVSVVSVYYGNIYNII